MAGDAFVFGVAARAGFDRGLRHLRVEIAPGPEVGPAVGVDPPGHRPRALSVGGRRLGDTGRLVALLAVDATLVAAEAFRRAHERVARVQRDVVAGVDVARLVRAVVTAEAIFRGVAALAILLIARRHPMAIVPGGIAMV